MKRRRRVRWFTFRIRGLQWRVWLSFGKFNGDDFEDCRGTTCNVKRQIVLSVRQHKSLLELHKTLGHELVHAACGATYTSTPLERMALMAEEYIADRVEQNLIPIFLSLGLELPSLPDGVELGT